MRWFFVHFCGWQRINAGVANHPRKMGRQNILEGEELTGLRAVHQNSDRIYQMFSLEKGEKNGLGFNGLKKIFCFSYQQTEISYISWICSREDINRKTLFPTKSNRKYGFDVQRLNHPSNINGQHNQFLPSRKTCHPQLVGTN